MLAKKKRSVKRKPPSSSEGCPPARGKTIKVGTYPSPSSTVGASDSLGRANEPPLEVLPISVWSPTSRGTTPPSTVPDEVTRNRNCSRAARDEDYLLSHAELAAGAVSSILRDFDLKRVGPFPVKEALALLLKGTASVCPSALVDLFLYCFSLGSRLPFFSFFLGCYLCEGLSKEGQPNRGL